MSGDVASGDAVPSEFELSAASAGDEQVQAQAPAHASQPSVEEERESAASAAHSGSGGGGGGGGGAAHGFWSGSTHLQSVWRLLDRHFRHSLEKMWSYCTYSSDLL